LNPAAAILMALSITFATVTWQSLKSARTNPVDALRYE
jgi:ABC-type lipoprotein release transport system permease subunit